MAKAAICTPIRDEGEESGWLSIARHSVEVDVLTLRGEGVGLHGSAKELPPPRRWIHQSHGYTQWQSWHGLGGGFLLEGVQTEVMGQVDR